MKSWYRTFAYVTASIVFGLLFIILTNSFFGYVNNPGWVGYVSLFAYGLVFVNLSFGMNRRYIKKRPDPASPAGYVMATLLVTPTLVWIYTKQTALAESRMVFTLTIVFATYLGAYYGIKTGTRKRADYLRKMREEQGNLPDDLKRLHDDLSKN
ncbi:MAG: hypothetical protein R3281_16570 [Balneolaceae bacterium]|nr:hypothetical protein [Balneolaceae bacterium]